MLGVSMWSESSKIRSIDLASLARRPLVVRKRSLRLTDQTSQGAFDAEHRQFFRYPFDFDGDAYPKRFIEELLIPCLASEPDVEAMIEMLRQFVAASLMRTKSLSKALVLVGGGANGKSTVQEVFRRVFRRKGLERYLTTWAKGFERQA